MVNDRIKNDIYKACEVFKNSENPFLLITLVFVQFPLLISFINFLVFSFTDIYFLYALMIIVDILLITILCLSVYYIRRYKSGKLKFNKSIYGEPKIGEEIVCLDKFYYDKLLWYTYKFSKYKIKDNEILSRCTIIDEGEVFTIMGVLEVRDEWNVLIRNNKTEKLYSIHYLKSSEFLKTKSQIRKNKLRRLKI